MGELKYFSPIGRCHHAPLQLSIDFNLSPVQKFYRTVFGNIPILIGKKQKNDCLSSFQLDQNKDVDCACMEVFS